MPLTLKSPGNVSGIQFDLNFCSSLLTFKSGATGDLASGFSFTANLYDSGKARVVIYSLSSLNIAEGEGPVAVLTFQVASGASSGDYCTLTLSGVNLSDAATNEISDFSLVNGSFTVSSCLKGDINDDSIINIQDVVGVVNIIMGKLIPDVRQCCAADTNSDSKINVQDVVKIVNSILGQVV